jgi:hypothetical protein
MRRGGLLITFAAVGFFASGPANGQQMLTQYEACAQTVAFNCNDEVGTSDAGVFQQCVTLHMPDCEGFRSEEQPRLFDQQDAIAFCQAARQFGLFCFT